jgi:hypothetical protein
MNWGAFDTGSLRSTWSIARERLAGSMSVCCKVTQCGCSHDPDVLITTHSRESLACKGLGGLWEKSISRALEERDGWRRQWTANVIAAPLAR